MPEGSCAPAYNAQVTTDSEAGIIVNANVTRLANDFPQLRPALKQVKVEHYYQAVESDCQACPHKARCCPRRGGEACYASRRFRPCNGSAKSCKPRAPALCLRQPPAVSCRRGAR